MVKDKDVVAWHLEHGIEYIPKDWGERDAVTGEGLENAGNEYWGEREHHSVSSWPLTPAVLEAQAHRKTLWPPRSGSDRDVMDALEDFFEPYLSMLPRPKGNVVREYMGFRRTQSTIAERKGITQQAVSARLLSAVRHLTRIIAIDDPLYRELAAGDGRRSFQDEAPAAAQRVLNVYWTKRFGHDLLV